MGGDTRLDRIEAHAKEILGLVSGDDDITPSQIAIDCSGGTARGSRQRH